VAFFARLTSHLTVYNAYKDGLGLVECASRSLSALLLIESGIQHHQREESGALVPWSIVYSCSHLRYPPITPMLLPYCMQSMPLQHYSNTKKFAKLKTWERSAGTGKQMALRGGSASGPQGGMPHIKSSLLGQLITLHRPNITLTLQSRHRHTQPCPPANRRRA
jgi:hypothetical protein